MKNKRNFNQRGITLVALVVTIIIVIILAGISIASLTGNGLFENAKLAKEKQENAKIEEEVTLREYENAIEGEVVGSRDTVTISKEEYDILKNGYTYSKDEKIVGEWIDGKPVYRKVYYYNTSFYMKADAWTNSGITINNVENIIDTRVFGGTYGVYAGIQSSINGTVGVDKNTLALYSKTSLMFDYIIIEYTKTIDTATNN